MKYLPLVWAALMRKKLRTLFTLLSIIVAFLLFGMLQGVNATFSRGVEGAHLDRLIVQGKVNMTDQLPLAYRERIAAVPGVTDITVASWFGGYYQDTKNSIFSFPVDTATYFGLFPEIVLPKAQLEALQKTRTGAVIGRKLAETYNWKVGDTIPIKSTIWTKQDGTSDWEFQVVGIFENPQDSSQEQRLFFNNDYFDEARGFDKGLIGWYSVHIDNPVHAGAISKAIDDLFANSDHETKTVTEKEFTQSFLKQLGDINFIVSAIIGAVFFALLFLTGNTMMQSVRERIPEFAILKTIGFPNFTVLALVVAEGLVLSIIAAALGLAGSAAAFPLLEGVVGVAHLPAGVVALGLFYAVLLALVTTLLPGLRVARLNLVDALGGR
ncbi:ABC transporter permease [Mesorhizobium sp. B2-1-8]|uniref:ABC transporter permease n=1 Tax=Mesorhizobium sp. B2-1-8 TaxID=2589967 RepID=UPI0011272D10|nr:FtsX-like permease family protein [Mesorhizobium sp. B2-1-8]UCI19929.1 ABC transporter permease [Mesorhizobium sp. B2-1-8]